jgi:hypothetical protein
MIATQSAPMSVARRGLRLQACVGVPAQRSSVIMRFREDKRPASAADVDSMEEKLHTGKPTDTKLSPEEIDSVSACALQMHQTSYLCSQSSLELAKCTSDECKATLGTVRHCNPGTWCTMCPTAAT